MAIINASAADFIPFSEGKSAVPNPSHSFDILALSEVAYCGTRDVGVTETIVFSDAPHDNDISASAGDTLAFTESSARGPHASAFDLLGLLDFAGMFHGGSFSDLLSFTDAAASETTKPGTDTLSLTETASVLINTFQAYSESLALNESAVGIRVTCLPVDQRLAVTLTYGTTTLTLTVPTFGDDRRRDFQRINRRSRGNDLIIFRDTGWVVSDHFTMKFDTLNKAQRDQLVDFLEFSTGQYITMTDYEGNTWRGFIMNPNATITQVASCFYSVELQFSGSVTANSSRL